ncbi:MAG: hypothetical protein Q4A75_01615 [Peptostreptococcaceae bacterium]|nr:hypothetical protein [Peptostreptococcaceae bacterium]
MKKIKTCLSVLTLLCMLGTTATIPVHAQHVREQEKVLSARIMPKWNTGANIDCSLSISAKKAYSSVVVEGDKSISKINVEIVLEEKVGRAYTEVARWSKTSNSRTLKFDNATSVTSGSYRLRVTAKVYEGSNYYTISDSTTASY